MSFALKSLATMLCAVALSPVAFAAQAADVGQHPAVFSPRALPSIDSNQFRPAHPAGPRAAEAAVHANAAHPAVRQHGRTARIDPNRFLVQPPASVHWAPAQDAAGDRVAAVSR